MSGGVNPRRLDCLAGGIQSKDVETATRQRLGGNPSAAADVEKVEQLRMCRGWSGSLPLPLREGGGGRGRRPNWRRPLPLPPSRKGRGLWLPSLLP